MCGIDSKTNFIISHLKSIIESKPSLLQSIKSLFFIPLSGNKIVSNILLENQKTRVNEKIDLLELYDQTYSDAMSIDFMLDLHKHKDLEYMLVQLKIHTENTQLKSILF